jgi:TDG/mug DNA glycosylase family protein
MAKRKQPDYEHLRLTDAIEPGVRVILVGINPGVLSATSGHHFAGPTNRFWGLLYASGIVPEPITHEDDVRLPQWGIGMTNLIARPSPGIDGLAPQEYIEGWKTLEKKIDRFRPRLVAFVGVTMYRMLWKVITQHAPGAPQPKGGGGPEVKPGFQHATVHGARIFVLPNPSGRNAHFSYDEMLAAFRELARALRQPTNAPPSGRRPSGGASSTESGAGGAGTSRRAGGTAARTTPSTPAGSPSRRVTRRRAGSRS